MHHKKYIQNRKPWEYEDEDLITLCCNCHALVHCEDPPIPIYNENGRLINNAVKCSKCHGSGYIDRYYYYMEGECFDCGGEGVMLDNL